MELFALGHGNGYTEDDVRAGARALTGWVIGADGRTSVIPKRHDASAKTLFGATRNFDAAGFCDAVLAQPKSAEYVARTAVAAIGFRRTAVAQALDRLVSAYGPARDLRALTRAILTDDEFTGSRAAVVNTPVEWLVGVIRALRVPIEEPQRSSRSVDATLRALGQRPFYPPERRRLAARPGLAVHRQRRAPAARREPAGARRRPVQHREHARPAIASTPSAI